MRSTILKIVLSSFLLTCNSYSQFYADSVISDYVIELFKTADSVFYSLQNGDNKIVNDDRAKLSIDKIAELYFNVFEEDPVGYNIYLDKLHKIWSSNSILPQSKPALKIHQIIKKIASKYGVPFSEIIGTPAFLRCKFLNLEFSNYKIIDGSNNLNLKAHKFYFLVEEILKGHKFFKAGDTIAVMMIPNVENPSPNLTKGNSYLIPIGTLSGLGQNGFNIVFQSLKDEYDVWKMGEPPRIFPIENEIIKDCGYFGFSEMNWDEFKKYFRENFLIFE